MFFCLKKNPDDGAHLPLWVLQYFSVFTAGPPQDVEKPAGPYPVIEKRGAQIVPVVQAYKFAKYLGKLVLTFDSEKRLVSAVGGPILLDQTVPQGRYSIINNNYDICRLRDETFMH